MLRLADDLSGLDVSAATVRNALLPLRAICRRALSRGDIQVNPTTGIEIPAVRSRRTRFATPEEAQLLIDAAPAEDRVLWATAFYAGLRRGELQALRWVDVDLAGGVLRVERSWDVKAGVIDPKSFAGRRKVPIAPVPRDTGRAQDGRRRRSGVLSHRRHAVRHIDHQPESEHRLARRAASPITLHECRHTFASLMIAAGVNPKALQTLMGHSSITVTLDRYGHLFPGSEEEVAVRSTPILRNHMSEPEAPAPQNQTVGKLWGSRTPLGAVLTGLERQARRPRKAPRARGNCPHMSRFRGLCNGEGDSNSRWTEPPIPVFETGEDPLQTPPFAALLGESIRLREAPWEKSPLRLAR